MLNRAQPKGIARRGQHLTRASGIFRRAAGVWRIPRGPRDHDSRPAEQSVYTCPREHRQKLWSAQPVNSQQPARCDSPAYFGRISRAPQGSYVLRRGQVSPRGIRSAPPLSPPLKDAPPKGIPREETPRDYYFR